MVIEYYISIGATQQIPDILTDIAVIVWALKTMKLFGFVSHLLPFGEQAFEPSVHLCDITIIMFCNIFLTLTVILNILWLSV